MSATFPTLARGPPQPSARTSQSISKTIACVLRIPWTNLKGDPIRAPKKNRCQVEESQLFRVDNRLDSNYIYGCKHPPPNCSYSVTLPAPSAGSRRKSFVLTFRTPAVRKSGSFHEEEFSTSFSAASHHARRLAGLRAPTSGLGADAGQFIPSEWLVDLCRRSAQAVQAPTLA